MKLHMILIIFIVVQTNEIVQTRPKCSRDLCVSATIFKHSGRKICVHILNYGLIVGTFHFLFNNSLVMFLSDTYCHHVPTPQFKSSTGWPEHRPRPGSAAGSPEAELEARCPLDKEAGAGGGTHQPLIAGAARGRGRGAPPGGAAGCCSSARWRR